MNTKPQKFKNITQYIHSVIDASEIFIEAPKNPDDPKKNWSEYKHHITLKVLTSVTPNSFINFVSKAYKGALSDKKTDTNKSVFRKVSKVSNHYG